MTAGRRRKRLTGMVVSTGTMAQTAAVALNRFPAVPKLRKRIRRTRVLLVHDPRGEARPGDRVVIEETRPISKRKHFRLVEIVSRASATVPASSGEHAPDGSHPRP